MSLFGINMSISGPRNTQIYKQEIQKANLMLEPHLLELELNKRRVLFDRESVYRHH